MASESAMLHRLELLRDDICYYREIAMSYREIVDRLYYEHEFRTDTGTLRNAVTMWDPMLSRIEEDDAYEDRAEAAVGEDMHTGIESLLLQNPASKDVFFDGAEIIVENRVLKEPTGSSSASQNEPTVPTSFVGNALPREAVEQRSGDSMTQATLEGQSCESGGSVTPAPDELQWWEDYSVIAPPPASTPEWDTARQDLFRYLKKRWEILNVERKSGELQYEILTTRKKQLIHGSTTEIQPILEKLFHLQETEAECRKRLLSTKLEPFLITKIDHLLSSERVENDSQGNRGRFRRYPTTDSSTYQLPATQTPLCVALSPSGSLADHDTRLSKFVAGQFLEGVSLSRFQSNMRAFLDAKERRVIHHLAGKGYKMKLTPNDIRPLERLHDDLCHAHYFFELLKVERLPNQHSDAIEQAWLRIIAVIAICYGCTPDPAFLLSTLDCLLDDLRSALGFQSSYYTDTSTGASQIKKINQANGGVIFELMSLQALPGDEVLAQSQCARSRLAELALFVRSSVITASVHTFQFPPFPSSMYPEIRIRTKFESLLRYDNICAGCGTELRLPSDETIELSQVISVFVKDIRIGHSLLRSGFSDNRRYIYECFSDFTADSRRWLAGGWSESFIPFFFHFAQLYHPECKVKRGKATASYT